MSTLEDRCSHYYPGLPRFSSNVKEAISLCVEAHAGQVRRYTGGPYSEHPIRVATHAARFEMSEDAVIAALLHDTVEDCDVTIADIDGQFGERAAYLVDMLTERHGGGNRTIRKWRELRRLQTTFDSDVHTLKLIDLADNAPSIILHDPKFAPVFVAEATALLDALWLAQRDARRLLIAGLMGKPEK